MNYSQQYFHYNYMLRNIMTFNKNVLLFKIHARQTFSLTKQKFKIIFLEHIQWKCSCMSKVAFFTTRGIANGTRIYLDALRHAIFKSESCCLFKREILQFYFIFHFFDASTIQKWGLFSDEELGFVIYSDGCFAK